MAHIASVLKITLLFGHALMKCDDEKYVAAGEVI